MKNVKLSDFTVDSKFDVSETYDCLVNYGAAVIPNYCDPKILVGLRDEFFKVLDDRDPSYLYPIDYMPGKAQSIMRSAEGLKSYPVMHEFFADPKMNDLNCRYIGDDKFFNYEIYATHEYLPGLEIAPTHFDKLWTLKFMLYLNDVGPLNAPFGVIPFSQKVGRARFREIFTVNNIQVLSMSDDLYQSMNNSSVPEDLGPIVDIVGSAGTMVIFDSDVFHHAGCISPGCDRRILRAHSGPQAIYKDVQKGSRQWQRGEIMDALN